MCCIPTSAAKCPQLRTCCTEGASERTHAVDTHRIAGIAIVVLDMNGEDGAWQHLVGQLDEPVGGRSGVDFPRSTVLVGAADLL